MIRFGGKFGEHQRKRPHYVGRGKRGAGLREIKSIRGGECRIDVFARGCKMNAARAEIGCRGQRVGRGGRGDGDDVVEVVARGIGGVEINIGGAVPTGGDDDDIGVAQTVNRVGERE